ncbi:hypothetical protein PP1Y_AT24807 [Novosphingobium sp. PP1Y]|nr:hypothetical protein PP1Y_AT24807 [Novosphingobium sp. PP1Y]
MQFGGAALSGAARLHDLKPGADVGHESAGSGIEKACPDLAGEALCGIEIGVPFAGAVGSDETVSLHDDGQMREVCFSFLTRASNRVFFEGVCPCEKGGPERTALLLNSVSGKP